MLAYPKAERASRSPWRTVVDRAYAAAVGSLSGDPGPVHLNLPLRDPLVPDLGGCGAATNLDSIPDGGGSRTDIGSTRDTGSAGSTPATTPIADTALARDTSITVDTGRSDGLAWTRVPQPSAWDVGTGRLGLGVIEDEPRTLVVLGDLPNPAAAQQACAIAAARGWPVLSEPFGYRSRAVQLPLGALLADAPELVPALRPEQILVLGRPTLSRAVAPPPGDPWRPRRTRDGEPTVG